MKQSFFGSVIVLLGLAAFCRGQSSAPQVRTYPSFAPAPQRNISGLVSGYEAWRLGDIRRRAAIGQQVDLEGDMFWRWSGIGSYYPGMFEAWPIVPGGNWGWPAPAAPPTVTGTRVAPEVDRAFAEPAAAGREALPAPPPNFVPAAQRAEIRERRSYSGPREF
jgi:hypothetical protein